jgi:dihydrodipicolinate synthase/N-acetylneuraminate lyase
MFKGSFVAIVTPFRDGKLDEAAFRHLLEFHLSNGTNGIVPCGTTGESPTLSHEEYERVIEITVEMVHGRLPVIAGTGFNAVVGVKESTGSLQQVQEMVKLCGDKLTVLSGDDWATLPLLSVGGKGVISVTANIAPREVATVIDEWEKGNVAAARELHYRLWPLHSTLFIETSPTPVKTALGMMGKISPEVRLPLAPMLPHNRAKLEMALKDFGLL